MTQGLKAPCTKFRTDTPHRRVPMKLLPRIGLALALAVGSGLSQAAIVSAGFNALGGNLWRVAITVQNDGTPASIPGLTVYFDESLFGNLSNATAPVGWDPLLFQPDTGLSAPGAFDALALGSAFEVMAGQTLSGFGLDVVYLGNGTPGPMAYEIYALDSAFAVVTLGNGTTVAPTAAVPEPMTAWLVALGLAGCAVTRRSAAVRHGSRA